MNSKSSFHNINNIKTNDSISLDCKKFSRPDNNARSKSLASASPIVIDNAHTSLTSSNIHPQPSSEIQTFVSKAKKGSSTSRSTFTLIASNINDPLNTTHNNIVTSAQPHSRNNIGNMSTSKTQLQPNINIVSNPNFEQNQKSMTEIKNAEDDDKTQIRYKNENNNTKPKPKRTSTRISASLRRLINLTFNRGSSTSSPLSSATAAAVAVASSSSSSSSTPHNKNQDAYDSQSSKYSTSKRDKPSNKLSSSKQRRQFAIISRNSSTNQFNSRQTHYGDKNQGISRKISIAQAANTTNGESTNSIKKNSICGEPELSNTTQAQPSWPPTSSENPEIDGKTCIECPLCVSLVSESSTPDLVSCRHRVCLECMQKYITTEINHSRLNITCPICSEPLHPNTIKEILQNEDYYLKYESFMLRRVLAAEPDARWCPAPDCGFVVLANGCASCPKLVCGREGCNTSFCYHCKQEWHPNQTCSAASIQRNKRLINSYNIADLIEESAQSPSNQKSSKSSHQSTIKADDIKECPVCASRIIKMNDGSCNHMTCSICETEFCWLCMKEISDLHYFSPSGCTFWGKKPWSRKKKLLWQLGMLVGAPICIILIAGIAVPAIVIGFSVWTARKLHNRLERKPFSRYRKNAIITGGVLLSFVVSPIISAFTLAIGIPILLGYVYGVVPLSLCRSSGGCLSSTSSLANLQQEFQAARNSNLQARDGISIDTAMSHKLGDPSIGETSMYLSNISLETNSIGHLTNVEREDRESASNAALAGSIISTTADDGNSTRALAGSIISKESGYMLIPAEVHNNQVNANNQMNVDLTNPTKSPETANKSEIKIPETTN